MFESSKETLTLLWDFTVIGFFLGFFYNNGRLIRLMLPKSRVLTAVIDFFTVTVSALTVFIFSVELGTGFLRLYYFIAALVGFAVYSVTFGLLTPGIARLSAAVFGYIRNIVFRLLIKPIFVIFGFIKQKLMLVFIRIHKIILNIAEKCKIYLKNRNVSLYNRKYPDKMVKLSSEGGEGRNVIVAKVRKGS